MGTESEKIVVLDNDVTGVISGSMRVLFRTESGVGVRVIYESTVYAGLHAAVPVGTLVSDGMIFAGESPEDMRPFYARANDEIVHVDWNVATSAAQGLRTVDGKQLRLLTDKELSVLFTRLGGFQQNTGYWSSTALNENIARVVYPNGESGWRHKTDKFALRLARGAF